MLTGLGSFGSLYSLKDIINNYEEPVLVQSIDGVGTKTKVAVMCGKFENLGYDLFLLLRMTLWLWVLSRLHF